MGFEGAVSTLCQLVAPLLGALWAGLVSLVAESIDWSLVTVAQTCGLAFLGLVSWFLKTWQSSTDPSPSEFPLATGEPPTCSAKASSPPPRVSSGTEMFSLTSLQLRLADPELEEEEWCDCGDLPEDDLSERQEWLRDWELFDCFLGERERERPLFGLLGWYCCWCCCCLLLLLLVLPEVLPVLGSVVIISTSSTVLKTSTEKALTSAPEVIWPSEASVVASKLPLVLVFPCVVPLPVVGRRMGSWPRTRPRAWRQQKEELSQQNSLGYRNWHKAKLHIILENNTIIFAYKYGTQRGQKTL